MGDNDTVKIQINQLTKRYPVSDRMFTKRSGTITAVNDVDLAIMEGETLGLVGESGCGKSTLGKIIVQLMEPTRGQILYRYRDEFIDITNLVRKDLKLVRRDMNMVFQDPVSSLNPRLNVRTIVAEPLILNKISKGRELDDIVAGLLQDVGLKPDHMHRFPHAFSGGQRQRIAIARALALGPSFMVYDEPTSALDVSIQGEILNLLVRLQKEIKLTSLFISHNISVVRHVSDRIAVMYLGRIVELGQATEVCASPRHPYTEALLSAVLVPQPGRKKERIVLRGPVPSPAHPPLGCGFSTRCPYREEVCVREKPPLKGTVAGDGRLSACHFADELSLAGV